MKVVADYKLKYNGEIRQPSVPFEANENDLEFLINEWGCKISEPSQETGAVDAGHAEESEHETPTMCADQSQIVEMMPEQENKKRTRKSRK